MDKAQNYRKTIGLKYWRIWSGIRIYYKDRGEGEPCVWEKIIDDEFCVAYKNKDKQYIEMYTTNENRENKSLEICLDIGVILDMLNPNIIIIYLVKKRLAFRLAHEKLLSEKKLDLEWIDLERLIKEHSEKTAKERGKEVE
jgi:hypothetical protein